MYTSGHKYIITFSYLLSSKYNKGSYVQKPKRLLLTDLTYFRGESAVCLN